jgi:hypothetical protein
MLDRTSIGRARFSPIKSSAGLVNSQSIEDDSFVLALVCS